MTAFGFGLTVVGLVTLVTAIRFHHPARFVAKPVASLGFLLVALASPAAGLRWWAIVIGLALGAVGDLLLMGSSSASFLAGLVSFLAGHVSYVVGLSTASEQPWVMVGVLVALAVTAFVTRWLRPHLDGPFRVAVPAYIVVIGVMLALGIGNLGPHPLAALGAVLFTASDVFVARDRFVQPGFVNSAVGLPLYYAGQLAIAASLAFV